MNQIIHERVELGSKNCLFMLVWKQVKFKLSSIIKQAKIKHNNVLVKMRVQCNYVYLSKNIFI